MPISKRSIAAVLPLLFASALIAAQQQAPAPARVGGIVPAPDRRADEGVGPFQTMVIRGVTIIDGTGAPP